MENLAETVYPAEWPGFPGETGAREQARADLRVADELSQKPSEPDWLTMKATFKAEEAAAFKEADESSIYDYEIETQRPVMPLEKVSERVSWRQRAKRLMGKSSEALRDVSIAVFTTAQVKAEDLKDYYSDEKFGKKRRRITAAVAGALAIGTTAYLNSKGVSSGSPHSRAASEAASLNSHLDTQGHIHHAVKASRQFVTVHDGQNPWTISRHHLQEQGNAHPSVAQITDYDQRLADANPTEYRFGDDSAEHIIAGTKLKLP